eukprot:GHVU01067755.1.p1 GENE.GHVU01067755.1~~GHVU01067755.1.p1  ORF type:complete len:207 (-),score=0.75 GHVU01067755.1:214-834(-)
MLNGGWLYYRISFSAPENTNSWASLSRSSSVVEGIHSNGSCYVYEFPISLCEGLHKDRLAQLAPVPVGRCKVVEPTDAIANPIQEDSRDGKPDHSHVCAVPNIILTNYSDSSSHGARSNPLGHLFGDQQYDVKEHTVQAARIVKRQRHDHIRDSARASINRMLESDEEESDTEFGYGPSAQLTPESCCGESENECPPKTVSHHCGL